MTLCWLRQTVGGRWTLEITVCSLHVQRQGRSMPDTDLDYFNRA